MVKSSWKKRRPKKPGLLIAEGFAMVCGWICLAAVVVIDGGRLRERRRERWWLVLWMLRVCGRAVLAPFQVRTHKRRK